MPAIPAALAALIQTNVNANLQAANGTAPLSQMNPSFFIMMCLAIGTGIATGSPVIAFTTSDSGVKGTPPIPGVGAGVGIVVDNAFFEQDLYTRIRGYIIADFGSTSHAPYPPPADNSGQNLLAICKGVADAVKTHYATAWVLTSAHPTVYMGTGTINNGDFSGLSDSLVKSLIVATAPIFVGPFWPKLAQAIAESYVATIHQHSTGMVTIAGVCVPGPSQVCGVPGSGSGSGVAA